jgi:hypothetical protein
MVKVYAANIEKACYLITTSILLVFDEIVNVDCSYAKHILVL